jgi:Reverse transcriptase (RNA-dependent DNA polymerase)
MIKIETTPLNLVDNPTRNNRNKAKFLQFNSIENGIMPKNMKKTVINPTPKTLNPKAPEEYRPINMLPIIEKIIESIIKKQLVEYIETNNILIPEQSGFRKLHSCESVIDLMLSNWMDNIQDDKDV